MKRIFKVILTIAVLYFIFQFGVSFFKNHHLIEYEIISDDLTFTISEEYKTDGNSSYYFDVEVNDLVFNLYLEHNYNKQIKVIENIEYYKTDEVLCVFPIFIDDIYGEVICHKDNNYYTKDTLEEANIFATKLSESDIDSALLKSDNETVEHGINIVYQNNILEDNTVVVWNYKGIDVFNNEELKAMDVLSSDQYNNTLGTFVEQYYFIPNYNQEHEFNRAYMIDVLELERTSEYISAEISHNSYVNGSVDNKLYITDKDNRVQYSIQTKSLMVVTLSDESNGKFYDGSWSDVDLSQLVDTNLYFGEEIEVPEELSNYSVKSIYKVYDYYYFISSDGGLYRVFSDNLSSPVLLDKDPGIKELIVRDNVIYYMIGDTVYYYSSTTGVKPVVTNSEFNYNSNNIYDVYKR